MDNWHELRVSPFSPSPPYCLSGKVLLLHVWRFVTHCVTIKSFKATHVMDLRKPQNFQMTVAGEIHKEIIPTHKWRNYMEGKNKWLGKEYFSFGCLKCLRVIQIQSDGQLKIHSQAPLIMCVKECVEIRNCSFLVNNSLCLYTDCCFYWWCIRKVQL